MTSDESMTYRPHSEEAKEVQYINSNTFGIACSDNVAYSSVCSGSEVKDSEYMVPCDGNIACSNSTRVLSEKRDECSEDVYEEVQATT